MAMIITNSGNKYKLGVPLARGGFGVVYKAKALIKEKVVLNNRHMEQGQILHSQQRWTHKTVALKFVEKAKYNKNESRLHRAIGEKYKFQNFVKLIEEWECVMALDD